MLLSEVSTPWDIDPNPNNTPALAGLDVVDLNPNELVASANGVKARALALMAIAEAQAAAARELGDEVTANTYEQAGLHLAIGSTTLSRIPRQTTWGAEPRPIVARYSQALFYIWLRRERRITTQDANTAYL